MAQQLIFTSVPRGLRPNTRGFTTAAASAGLTAPMMDRLEAMSGYAPVSAQEAPVAFSYQVARFGTQRIHILSRASSAAADYSGRSNQIAHHLVVERGELPPGGAADVLLSGNLFRQGWEGDSQTLPTVAVPRLESGPAPCQAWAQATGDAGWGGAMVRLLMASATAPVFVVFQPGQEVLPLFAESLRLMPPARRTSVTFTTYATAQNADVECQVMGVAAGSTLHQAILKTHPARILDLAKMRVSPAPQDAFTEAARRGVVYQAAQAAAVAPVVRPVETKAAVAGAVKPPPVRGQVPQGDYALLDEDRRVDEQGEPEWMGLTREKRAIRRKSKAWLWAAMVAGVLILVGWGGVVGVWYLGHQKIMQATAKHDEAQAAVNAEKMKLKNADEKFKGKSYDEAIKLCVQGLDGVSKIADEGELKKDLEKLKKDLEKLKKDLEELKGKAEEAKKKKKVEDDKTAVAKAEAAAKAEKDKKDKAAADIAHKEPIAAATAAVGAWKGKEITLEALDAVDGSKKEAFISLPIKGAKNLWFQPFAKDASKILIWQDGEENVEIWKKDDVFRKMVADGNLSFYPAPQQDLDLDKKDTAFTALKKMTQTFATDLKKWGAKTKSKGADNQARQEGYVAWQETESAAKALNAAIDKWKLAHPDGEILFFNATGNEPIAKIPVKLDWGVMLKKNGLESLADGGVIDMKKLADGRKREKVLIADLKPDIEFDMVKIIGGNARETISFGENLLVSSFASIGMDGKKVGDIVQSNGWIKSELKDGAIDVAKNRKPQSFVCHEKGDAKIKGSLKQEKKGAPLTINFEIERHPFNVKVGALKTAIRSKKEAEDACKKREGEEKEKKGALDIMEREEAAAREKSPKFKLLKKDQTTKDAAKRAVIAAREDVAEAKEKVKGAQQKITVECDKLKSLIAAWQSVLFISFLDKNDKSVYVVKLSLDPADWIKQQLKDVLEANPDLEKELFPNASPTNSIGAK